MQGMLNCFPNTIDKCVIKLTLKVSNSTLLNINLYFKWLEFIWDYIHTNIKWMFRLSINFYIKFIFSYSLYLIKNTRAIFQALISLIFLQWVTLKSKTLGHFPLGNIFHICRTIRHSHTLLYHFKILVKSIVR